MNTKFNTVDDVLNDPKFGLNISDHIRRIEQNRTDMLHKAHQAEIDTRIRRHPFDCLKDSGKLHPNDPVIFTRLILQKKSKLSSTIRAFVYNIVTLEMRNTIEFYKPAEESQNKEVEPNMKPLHRCWARLSDTRKRKLLALADERKVPHMSVIEEYEAGNLIISDRW